MLSGFSRSAAGVAAKLVGCLVKRYGEGRNMACANGLIGKNRYGNVLFCMHFLVF